MKEFSGGSEPHICGKRRLNLWYCEHCRKVHLRAGETVLSFDSREFAAFTEAVVDIHYSSGWQMSQWALPSGEETNEILASEMIA